jgi:hypothetical protein
LLLFPTQMFQYLPMYPLYNEALGTMVFLETPSIDAYKMWGLASIATFSLNEIPSHNSYAAHLTKDLKFVFNSIINKVHYLSISSPLCKRKSYMCFYIFFAQYCPWFFRARKNNLTVCINCYLLIANCYLHIANCQTNLTFAP